MTNKEKFLAKMPFSIAGRYDPKFIKLGVYQLFGDDQLMMKVSGLPNQSHGWVTVGKLSIEVNCWVLDKKVSVKLKYSLMVFDKQLLRY